jgi:hypothetical protein
MAIVVIELHELDRDTLVCGSLDMKRFKERHPRYFGRHVGELDRDSEVSKTN